MNRRDKLWVVCDKISKQRLDKDYPKSRLLLKLEKYGTVDSSCRQRIARTDENGDVIESLLLNQDNMNGHVKLNMDIIFGGVVMLCSKS